MRFRMPSIRSAAVSAGLGAAAAVVLTGSAAHAEPYPPGDYLIGTGDGERCLNSAADADTVATVGPCDTVWRFRLMSDGIQIIRAAPDACLGVSPADVWPRELAVRSCAQEPTLWYATHAGDGRYLISLASDGQLLTWQDGTQNAFLVPERPDHDHQLWVFEPVER